MNCCIFGPRNPNLKPKRYQYIKCHPFLTLTSQSPLLPALSISGYSLTRHVPVLVPVFLILPYYHLTEATSHDGRATGVQR
eukprot:1390766-Amorphochlora_amoeboformis.AAC.1